MAGCHTSDSRMRWSVVSAFFSDTVFDVQNWA